MGAHFYFRGNVQLKKSKTYKEQVEILKKKGLAVGNDGDVVNFLNHVNYYRFSGYFLSFISQSEKKFHNKTSFEKLKNIYYLDSELRKLLMGTIDEIEIYLKSQISYYHSQKYGAEGYTDGVNYNAKHNHVAFMHRISACIAENQRTICCKNTHNVFFATISILE